MSFPQVLEVAIGLILVYYILGSIVSLGSQILMESLETRGLALEKYLKKVAGDKYVDLTSVPQIKALQPVRYKNWWSVLDAGTEPKRVEKIPVGTLVDAFFDLTGLTGRKEINAGELTALIGKLPESEGKQALLHWIGQGVTNLNDLRERTSSYFAGILEQAAATFRANARSFVIIFSIALTVLFGTDSIQLARDLWTNAGLRAVAAAKASAVVQQQGDNADLTSLLNDLGALSIKIGWWRTQNFPSQGSPIDRAKFIGFKILGLGVTAVAVSQGSSFWYDLLKKITSPPSPGKGGEVNDAKA